MREQVNSIRFVQERYAWFLEEVLGRSAEKKKGQRKKPLAQQIYESCLDAFVSGVSLGKSSEVDAPSVNIQYAVLELDETHHELVEKLYFDRLTDFVYVELMRGLQRGMFPNSAPTADGGSCRHRGTVTITAANQPPTARKVRPAGRLAPPRASGPRC